MRKPLVCCSVALLLARGASAAAQELRGAVRDSVTQTALSGAVITLLGADGRILARAISNENGLYRAFPTTGARAVSVLRIGFRPRNQPYDGAARLDLMMAPIPPLLEPVTVRAGTNCPARADRLQALSLLQQARAGLLATVTARQTNRAALVRLRFIRHYDERGREIVEQHVTVDSAGELSESFGAVRSGAQFVAEGFTGRLIAGNAVHYGPDAETLLDDDFAAGYCFHIDDPDVARPTQIGLGFKPSSRRNGRVDVQGTLWIDTVSKALRDIVFDYVGDARPVGAPQTGGHIEFRQMGNGIVIIDRWSLRLFAARPDTSYGMNNAPIVRAVYHVQESGGEVASATWGDGFKWEASLGALRALVVDHRNAIPRGVIVRLRDTDYLGSPNARGIMEIPHLLPGPYVAMVTDSALQRLGIMLPTSLTFAASRDSLVERSFSLPRREDFVLESCLRTVNSDSKVDPLTIRVVDAFGKPVMSASVDITRNDGSPSQEIRESLDTDERGTATSCLVYHPGDEFRVTVTRGNDQPYAQTFRYRNGRIVIRLANGRSD